MLPAPQVTRLQYLNALLATRAQALPQSPENTELLAIPGSQTRLLGDKAATAPGEPGSRSVAPRVSVPSALLATHTHTHTRLCALPRPPSVLSPFISPSFSVSLLVFLIIWTIPSYRPAGILSRARKSAFPLTGLKGGLVYLRNTINP